jgi:hypothetical protein
MWCRRLARADLPLGNKNILFFYDVNVEAERGHDEMTASREFEKEAALYALSVRGFPPISSLSKIQTRNLFLDRYSLKILIRVQVWARV